MSGQQQQGKHLKKQRQQHTGQQHHSTNGRMNRYIKGSSNRLVSPLAEVIIDNNASNSSGYHSKAVVETAQRDKTYVNYSASVSKHVLFTSTMDRDHIANRMLAKGVRLLLALNGYSEFPLLLSLLISLRLSLSILPPFYMLPSYSLMVFLLPFHHVIVVAIQHNSDFCSTQQNQITIYAHFYYITFPLMDV